MDDQPKVADRPQPRPSVLDITPYKAGDAKIPGHAQVVKLASNESPLGPSPQAVEAIRAGLGDLERYPDPASVELRAAIGAAHDLDPDALVVGSGSEQLLGHLIRLYADAGDEVLQTEHAFVVYRIAARGIGAVPVFAPETDFTTDVDALASCVTQRTRVVCVANPGNPTGTWLPASELRRLRAALPSRILLVIDAAYAEYLEQDDSYTAGHDLVAEAARTGADNVVVTRTFSKVYGLAALRLGWMHGPPSVVDAVNRVREAFNVTRPAQVAGVAALADRVFVRAALELNAQELARVSQAVGDMGLAVSPSGANFVLVHFPGGPDQAVAADAALRDAGIIVRPVANYGLPQCLRITIGTEAQNRIVINGLQRFLGG